MPNKTSKVFFIEKAHDFIMEYEKKGNTLDITAGHHDLPDNLTIIDIVNKKFLIGKDLKVYLVAQYINVEREDGARTNLLGIVPFYHEFKSPVLLPNHIIRYADGMFYCEFCDTLIEPKLPKIS